MKKSFLWIVAAGSTLVLLNVWAYALPEFGCLLASLVVFLLLLALLTNALIVGVARWRLSSRLWPILAFVGLGFILGAYYVSPWIGRHISDRIFEKNRPGYVSVVQSFKEGHVRCAGACNGDVGEIEAAKLPAHVARVWGAHCSEGGVVLLFWLDADVPLLHEGYWFGEYKEGSDCGRRFGGHELNWSDLPYARHIEGGWYRVSDKPGL